MNAGRCFWHRFKRLERLGDVNNDGDDIRNADVSDELQSSEPGDLVRKTVKPGAHACGGVGV
jgi:hypothetical protein